MRFTEKMWSVLSQLPSFEDRERNMLFQCANMNPRDAREIIELTKNIISTNLSHIPFLANINGHIVQIPKDMYMHGHCNYLSSTIHVELSEKTVQKKQMLIKKLYFILAYLYLTKCITEHGIVR